MLTVKGGLTVGGGECGKVDSVYLEWQRNFLMVQLQESRMVENWSNIFALFTVSDNG